MRVKLDGKIVSIIAKSKGYGATAEMVGVAVITETHDEETGVGWKASFDLPLSLISDELKVGATVEMMVAITETVEADTTEEEEK